MSKVTAAENEVVSHSERDIPQAVNEEVGPELMRVAKSRLRIELQGLAFAISRGATPEEYARFLWGQGAAQWMGTISPGADEYLLKEAEAMSRLFPWVKIVRGVMSPAIADVVLANGCLAGWGENRFRLTRDLGLNRIAVCRYCIEACKVWGEQLGLQVEPRPGPGCRGGCHLTASRRAQLGQST